MTGGMWICVGLVVMAAVVALLAHLLPDEPPCEECEATEPSAGNPAGQCFSCWSKEPAMFDNEVD